MNIAGKSVLFTGIHDINTFNYRQHDVHDAGIENSSIPRVNQMLMMPDDNNLQYAYEYNSYTAYDYCYYCYCDACEDSDSTIYGVLAKVY